MNSESVCAACGGPVGPKAVRLKDGPLCVNCEAELEPEDPEGVDPADELACAAAAAGRMVLRIRDWNEHFENSRSREIDHCSFSVKPNKQFGMGFTAILAQPDGLTIYGVWCLIVEACSLQRRPRQGFLTDTGRADGRPWTARTLALRWRAKEQDVQRALDFLSDPDVGWAEIVGPLPTNCRPAADKVPTKGVGREPKGTEQKGTGLNDLPSAYADGSANTTLPDGKDIGCFLSGQEVWARWSRVNIAFGRNEPARIGPDLAAAKQIGMALPTDRLDAILQAFLGDDDNFLSRQGHGLRLLPARVNRYLNQVGDPDESITDRIARIVEAGGDPEKARL